MFSDRTESFKRLLVETGGVEVEFLEPAIPDFIKDVNEICVDIVKIKSELERETIRDIKEIIVGFSKDSSVESECCENGTISEKVNPTGDNCGENKKVNLTEEIHKCQGKMLELESKYDLRQKTEAKETEINNKYPHRVVVVSCIYTLLGELSSLVQSKMAKELEEKYTRKNRFATKLSNIGLSGSNNRFENSAYRHTEINHKEGQGLSPDVACRNDNECGYSSYFDHDSCSDYHLSPEMERMAQELLNHFTSDIDALRESQNQLHEISSLMTFFSSKIQEQSEICTSIFSSAQDAVCNLDSSKIHFDSLEEASKSRR